MIHSTLITDESPKSNRCHKILTATLQVYTDSHVDVPITWEESDPKYINNQQEVRDEFKSLSSWASRI